uniref:FERM domain-containing protein n=1 Tax=Strongyloides stercoralis TaxID=6248 RepID=A0A0K0EJV8_STRER
MGYLKLNIICEKNQQKSVMTFDPSMLVYDACRQIRDKFRTNRYSDQNGMGNYDDSYKDYGLFRVEPDPTKCVWMENGKTLEHYLIRNNDTLEYKNKIRQIKIRTLDGSVKIVPVDESQNVGQLMVTICGKIGIYNPEEYSLTRDDAVSINGRDSTTNLSDYPDYNNKRNGYHNTTSSKKTGIEGNIFGTMNRKKQKKLEQLRHKLHTDEEISWVDHGKTLREQGILDDEILVLRRKFFFSDANVERDPVQLNLLYVQCRDDVLKSFHPVNKAIATRLAALQAFIEFGPYNDQKVRGIDFKQFLPAEYKKNKDIEKRVLQQYQEFNFSDPTFEPKRSYIQECKELYTYGVTFFVVQEQLKDKKQLEVRLLGINKDCIMILDQKTKEVIKEYPLEQLRRWATSPTTFAVDLGDYEDGYFAVQTPDGEKIVALIAGYIDIIIKKRKLKDHLGIEGDEGSTMLEDRVAPAKATLIAHGEINTHGMPIQDGRVALPGVLRHAGSIDPSSGVNGAEYGAVSGQILTRALPHGQRVRVVDSQERAQRALVGTIEASIKAVEEAEEELYKPPEIQLPRFDDPSSRKWIETQKEVQKEGVSERISAMGAATAEVVQLTAVVDETDHRVGSAVATIGSNLPEMGRNVRELAALMTDNKRADDLVTATRNLCGAMGDFLHTVNPENDEKRNKVFAAAGRVGEYSQQVLNTIEEQTIEDKLFHDELVQKAKTVATSTAQLVLKAKTISADCSEPIYKEKVIHSATQCAYATSQLVACARVVAPSIETQNCKEQLSNASKQVAGAVETLLIESKSACQSSISGNGEKSFNDIHAAAKAVTSALDGLLDHVYTGKKYQQQQHDTHFENILRSSNRLITSQTTTQNMVKESEHAIRHSRIIVEQIENEAAEQEPEQREKLLSAARSVAQATSNMIDATKQCQKTPGEAEHQVRLKTAAETLVNATSNALASQNTKRTFDNLEQAAKATAAAATQTIAASNQAAPLINNRNVTETLIVQCTETAEVLPSMIGGIRESQTATTETEKFKAQSRLIHDTSKVILPATRLTEVARRTVSSVPDQNVAANLQLSSQRLNEAVAELRVALNNAQHLNYDLTLVRSEEIINELDEELIEIGKSYEQGSLTPLPHERAETSSQQVVNSSKALQSSVAQFISSKSSNDKQHLGTAAVDTSYALREFTSSIHSVCSTRKEANVPEIVRRARSVVHTSGMVYDKIKQNAPTKELCEVGESVTSSIKECLNTLPDNVFLDNVYQAVSTIDSSSTPIKVTRQHVPIEEIRKKADNVIDTSGKLMITISAPEQSGAVECFVKAYTSFYTTIKEAIIINKSQEEWKEKQYYHLKETQKEALNMIEKIKERGNDMTTPQTQQSLIQSTKTLAETVNVIVEEFSEEQQSPWIAECDNSLRQIESYKHILDSALYPINDKGYYESLEAVTEQAKKLGEGMTGIAKDAKAVDTPSLCNSVRIASEAVCGLAEFAAQSAYLVGVSEPSSIPGRSALFDKSQCEQHLVVIQEICQIIQNENYDQRSLLDNVTILSKHTSKLASLCQDASKKTNNINIKKQFVKCGSDVATATTNLIGAVKAVDNDINNGSKKIDLTEKAYILNSSCQQLYNFICNPEFSPVQAKISARGAEAQKPVLQSGREMLYASCEMIKTAKQLAISPKDSSTWQRLADNSKVVSDSIKKLVSAIRDEAPGKKDLENAIYRLEQMIERIEVTSNMYSNDGQRSPHKTIDQRFQQQIIHASQSIIDRIESFKNASKYKAEGIPHEVHENMLAMESLIQSTIQSASTAPSIKTQTDLFNYCKKVVERECQLMVAANDCCGNPNKPPKFHQIIDEAGNNLYTTLTELQRYVKVLESQSGVIHGMIDSISKSIAKTDETYNIGHDNSFTDAQTRMTAALENIKKIATDMRVSDPSELGTLALKLTDNYQICAEDSIVAIALLSSPTIGHKLRIAVQKLGTSCIELVKTAGQRRNYPNDKRTSEQLTDETYNVVERVEEVLAALHEGSKGTQACINAANTVSGIIGDLDTTIMFATSGSLNTTPQDKGSLLSGDKFSGHRENILKTAKALVEDTKALVSGAASNQEQLAVAAQNAVRTIVNLTEAVKNGAISLHGDNAEAQVMVIHAVKDVASALANLIQATKNASGRQLHDPAMNNLKEAAKQMVSNVTGLLKTVKTIENESQRGTRALEATIEAIENEIKTYNNGEHYGHGGNYQVGDMIRATKSINDAANKAINAAGTLKQDDMIGAANLSRQAISDLLAVTSNIATTVENAEIRYKIIDSGREVAIQIKELLIVLHNVLVKNGFDKDSKNNLTYVTKKITEVVDNLLDCGESLKGDEEWMDHQDAVLIAENELMGAATSIKAAAVKLAQMKPRRHTSEITKMDENLEFDEQILEGCRSILNAVNTLVKAASEAQRELIAQGRIDPNQQNVHASDYQWSEGLTSAAKLVAAAAHQLCEAANGVVLGHGTEEKLSSAAKQIASSTAHLLVACKVKADLNSRAMQRLQTAGLAVKTATEHLVNAAKQSITEDDTALIISQNMVKGISQVMDAQEIVLRKERELQEARQNLATLNKQRYFNRNEENEE